MSKLEVDTIDTTSGGSGTLTIGSDQNAALKVKREATTSVTGDGSTTTSASAGDILLVDVSSATATIQLPASPNVGDVVSVTDISASAGTNNITINVDASGNSSTTGNGEQGKALGIAIQAAVMETLQREKRPGGVLGGG